MGGSWNILKKLKLVEDVNDKTSATVVSDKSLEELLAEDPEAQASSAATEELRSAAAGLDTDKVVFDEIFQAAGIKSAVSVDKVIELRANLPAETPLDVSRKIVFAALKSFSINVKDIVKDAASKHDALEQFIQIGKEELQSVLTENTKAIQQKEEEIRKLKDEMDKKTKIHQNIANQCQAMVTKLEEAVDFLTEGEMVTQSNKK
jgi:hypothetical protein